MQAIRLYQLPADLSKINSIRKLEITDGGFYAMATFILEAKEYVVFYGIDIDDNHLEEIWSDKPSTAESVKNPANDQQITPLAGKFVRFFSIPPTKVRLDVYLAERFDKSLSRSLWQKYIKDGRVLVDGRKITTPSTEISSTTQIEIDHPEAPQATGNIPVIYENDEIIAVNKPAGILTHAKGGLSNEYTVADFARLRTSYQTDTNRPGIIHRLDRDTSGVIIIARNPDSAKSLQKQFADRTAKKTYLAITKGPLKHQEAKIDLPIARNPAKPSTFRVDPKGKEAITYYKVLATDGEYNLVKLQPVTGRTHQLRVHMAHAGSPIHGDRVYGAVDKRLMLHAYEIEIKLGGGKLKKFTAKVPQAFHDRFKDIKL